MQANVDGGTKNWGQKIGVRVPFSSFHLADVLEKIAL